MHIRHATRRDLADIATIAHRAMLNDELSEWLMPNQRETPYLHRQRCLRSTIRRYNTGLTMLVMVLDPRDAEYHGTERIVGYAAYEKKCGGDDDSSRRSTGIFNGFEKWAWNVQETYNWYVRDNLRTDKEKYKILCDVIEHDPAFDLFQRYWMLDFLAVDPEFFRRGIGSRLVVWGQDRAREDGVPLWLWSSVVGERVYSKLGFRQCETAYIGPLVVPVMAWEAEREG